MDELSWRAKLAKANINILDIHDEKIFLEFTYHPKPGVFKWCKTVFSLRDKDLIGAPEEYQKVYAQQILDKVLSIRKELEE